MLRPKDAPYHPPPPAPVRVEAPAPAREVVVEHAPRPLYECVTPDGTLYTSETPEGNPRWVPLWTLDLPYGGPIVSTSANLSGAPPAFARDALDPALLALCDGVTEGETGGLDAPTGIVDARSGTRLRG